MGVIRSHFDHIHESLNMKKEEHVVEEVPCICGECRQAGVPYFHKYHELQKFLARGKDARCGKSADDLSVHLLINGLLPPKEPGSLFEALVTITSQLQGIKKTLHSDEDSRNTVVALLLGIRGFRVKD